jgi:hypothetical protein
MTTRCPAGVKQVRAAERSSALLSSTSRRLTDQSTFQTPRGKPAANTSAVKATPTHKSDPRPGPPAELDRTALDPSPQKKNLLRARQLSGRTTTRSGGNPASVGVGRRRWAVDHHRRQRSASAPDAPGTPVERRDAALPLYGVGPRPDERSLKGSARGGNSPRLRWCHFSSTWQSNVG